MSGQSVNLIGMCGKIASRGDFVAQNLSTAFIDIWQEWLQAVLAVSREQLGAAWLDTYLTSPVWHFALSAGVCGEEAMCGTLMPSVDQVGRHFPFTLARRLQGTPVSARLNDSWAQALQDQILQTLEDDFVFEHWLAALLSAEIDWPAPEMVTTPAMPPAQGRAAWVLTANSPLQAEQLLHHSYRQQFGRYCIWWTDGSPLVEPCTLLTQGLPQVSQFGAMLDGQWQRGHWQQAQILSNGADSK